MVGYRSSTSKFFRDIIYFIGTNSFISFSLFVLALYRFWCFQACKKKFDTKNEVNYETHTTYKLPFKVGKIFIKVYLISTHSEFETFSNKKILVNS